MPDDMAAVPTPIDRTSSNGRTSLMRNPLLRYRLTASPLPAAGGSNKLGLAVGCDKSGPEIPVSCAAITIAVPIGNGADNLTDHPETIEMSQAGGLEPARGGGWMPQAQMNDAGTYMIFTWKPLFQTGRFDASWDLHLELDQIHVNPDATAVEVFIAEHTTADPSDDDATYKISRADLSTATITPSDGPAAFGPLP